MRRFALLPTSLLGAALAIAFAPRVCADVIVTVDKDTQIMNVTVDGELRYTWQVSTGKSGYDTPVGTFRPNRMDPDHYSQEFGNAPMPYTIFFDMHGHAIHGFLDASRIGNAASHGCVRLSAAHAAVLFALVRTRGMHDTTVVISGPTAPPGPDAARGRGPATAVTHLMKIATRSGEQPAPHSQQTAALGGHPAAVGQRAEACATNPTNGDELLALYVEQPAGNGEQGAPHAQQTAANAEHPIAEGQRAEADAQDAAEDGSGLLPEAKPVAADEGHLAAGGELVAEKQPAKADEPHLAAVDEPPPTVEEQNAEQDQTGAIGAPVAVGEPKASTNEQQQASIGERPASGEQVAAAYAPRPEVDSEPLAPSPSVDCTGESGAVEQAICGNRELSQLDLDMDRDVKVALEWLNDADAEALRADQRAWLANRPALLAGGVDLLKAGMEERVAMVEGTILNAFPLLGEWVNHAASIIIRDRHGLIVDFRNRQCDNLGSAYYASDTGTIVVRADGGAAENWSLRISRRGPLLMVEELPPARPGNAAAKRPCSEASGVSGIYFQKARNLPLPSLGETALSQ